MKNVIHPKSLIEFNKGVTKMTGHDQKISHSTFIADHYIITCFAGQSFDN